VEAQHDVVLRYASFYQFESNAAFGAVVLNPDFAVFDVEVEYADVDSAFVGPTDVDDLVSIALGIENRLCFDLFVISSDVAAFMQ
jgi:hypothetical protein